MTTNKPSTKKALHAPPPSFVKLAMKNMVRNGSQSLVHFGLTALGFVGFILVIAWFARPNLPQ